MLPVHGVPLLLALSVGLLLGLATGRDGEGRMATEDSGYLLSQGPDEIRRLQSWGRVWEPEAETMLDHIGVQPGWRCLDLGCGPMGILRALSRRVGDAGQVVAADINPKQLDAARELTQREGLTNIEFVKVDAFDTGLPRESFDLVHVRFLFSPLGRDEALMQELLRLLRPGGVLAAQEADECSYICYPPQEAWERLKTLTAAAFAARWWRRQCRTSTIRVAAEGRASGCRGARGGLGSTGWTSIQAVATRIHHRHAATNQGVGPHVRP